MWRTKINYVLKWHTETFLSQYSWTAFLFRAILYKFILQSSDCICLTWSDTPVKCITPTKHYWNHYWETSMKVFEWFSMYLSQIHFIVTIWTFMYISYSTILLVICQRRHSTCVNNTKEIFQDCRLNKGFGSKFPESYPYRRRYNEDRWVQRPKRCYNKGEYVNPTHK